MHTGAVIAAAGLSSRMGRFKPMLPVGAQSAIRRLAGVFLDAGAGPVVVVTGYRADELKAHLTGLDVVCLRNEDYERTHMFDSARIGFSYLAGRCERVFFTPADVPLIHPETVRALMESAAPVAIPCFEGRTGHPILLSRDVLEKVCTDSGEGGLKGAVRRSGVPITLIDVPDQHMLLDMDTPEDYRAILDADGVSPRAAQSGFKEGQG